MHLSAPGEGGFFSRVRAGSRAEASTIARLRSGWKSFRVLLPLLANRIIPLKTKWRLYVACSRSVMAHGSETWPLKVEDITRISRVDKMMIRWMCNVSLKDGRSSDELRDRLGILDTTEVLRKNRLRWFGHVMRMDAGNPASACRLVVVEGKREQGRPRKTWSQLISNDLRIMKLKPDLPMTEQCREELL